MNTTSACVIVACCTPENMREILGNRLRDKGIRLGPGRDFLTLITNWQTEAKPIRRELFPFPTDNPESCRRLANFYELCAFALKHPTFPTEVGEIECFDDSIDEMSKEIGVQIAIPVFGIVHDEVCIYLRDKRIRAAEYKLGVV